MDFSGAYPTIKFVHILLAIVAIGFNATYGIWISHAARHSPKELGFALRGVKRLDDRWANTQPMGFSLLQASQWC